VLTIFLLISLRYASLGDIFFFVPVKEETSVFDLHNMLPEWASAALNIPAYLLLIVTFILNVLIMVPVAQFCGHVMLRANTLAGYGCNLLGSIAGVGLLFLLSWLWTGPVIWFAVAAALLLAYQLVSYELSLERNHYIGLGAAMACIIITAYNLRMGFKIYSILSGLPGAGAPVAVLTGYDTDKTYTFMVRKDGAVALPIAFMAAHDLVDRTSDFAKGWPQKLDVPTDDWPFFYMDARMYPTSYVISLLLVLALAALLVRKLLPNQRWNRSLMPFFFLGAGFMLVETKAITELGLLFGNTWHATGIAIIGILVMAFLGNLLVAYGGFRSPTISYMLLLATIAAGYAVALAGGVTQADLSAKLSLVALLTGPLLFSGIVFSTLLKNVEDLPSALAYNLLGAMLGGLLEYNSMEFGFAFLYLIAFALYGLALATTWLWPASAR
jgi:hypothetical protein